MLFKDIMWRKPSFFVMRRGDRGSSAFALQMIDKGHAILTH